MTGKWDDPGVPHRGWTCVDCHDLEDERQTCEMCETQEIRYVHVMTHPDWPGELECGCICAGQMEGDYERAKAREDGVKADGRRRVREEKLRRNNPELYARRMKERAAADVVLAATKDIFTMPLQPHEFRFVADVAARTERKPAYATSLTEKQTAWLDALLRRKLQRDALRRRHEMQRDVLNARFRVFTAD